MRRDKAWKISLAALPCAGILAFAPAASGSATSDAGVHETTVYLATTVANERAKACFDMSRVSLLALEGKGKGVKIEQIQAAMGFDPKSEEWRMVELGYLVASPSDERIKSAFVACLEKN